MKTYFVTGSTGGIGAALVPALLLDNDTRVRLLVRAKNQAHLKERLEGLLSFWEYGLEPEEIVGRIRAIGGDVSIPGFGLEAEEYEALAGECTHIVHCAGVVRMNLPLAEARKAAVDPAKNIVALARACKDGGNLKKVEFISTVGVGGRMSGTVPERWITEKRAFHNTYEEAKAEAETYIAAQIEDGLPITVHRPSMVVGDSVTGKIINFQIFYHICEFLSGRRTRGFVPRIRDARLDIIPGDYVARVLAWSSTQDSTIGKIIHLCSGPEEAIEISALMEKVQKTFRAFGENLPRSIAVPLAVFKGGVPILNLLVPQNVKRSMQALPFLFAYLEEKQSFANTYTREMLKDESIVLPSVDEYLEHVLRYYLQHRRVR